MRSPAAFLTDAILRLCFLPAMDKKPRTLCACHPVASRSSVKLAPCSRPIKARILPPLVSTCGGRAFSTAIGCTVFLLAFGVRFDSATLAGWFAAAFVGGRLVAVFPALATLF